MNRKAVQIFLAAGLISSLGVINACSTGTDIEGGENGIQEENMTQPDDGGEGGENSVQEENMTQPDDEDEGGEG